MEKFKESFSAKVAAFIILVICAVIVGFSALITAYNADYRWYSKNEKAVMNDIYERTAQDAGNRINNWIGANWGLITGGNVNLNDTEILSGENGYDAFGYSLKLRNHEGVAIPEASASKELHPEMKTVEGTYITPEFSFYNLASIQVYLGQTIIPESVPPEIYSTYIGYMNLYKFGKPAIAVGSISVIIAFCLLIFLFTGLGRKENEHSIISRFPIEVLLAIEGIPLVIVTALTVSIVSGAVYVLDFVVVAMAFYIALFTSAILGFSMMVVIKIRQRNLWKTSLLHKVIVLIKKFFHGLGNLFKMIPIVWKAALILGAGILFNLFFMMNIMYTGMGAIMWLVGSVVVFAAGIYFAAALKKLKDGGKHLAEGDLDYQINKDKMYWDLAEHADNLNSIRDGISKAVEGRMKSERLKNELITNVSHDIKTPLTSIINYVDFLKKEDIDSEKVREYIEVLDRQSQRLKKLTEDLVEASKAATGNIKLDMQVCQVGVMMQQVMGEYKEKTEEEDLKMITTLPEKQLEIMADGRSLWRVFDNILNNICKYSQAGTRVYQTLEEKDGKAVITYRNTSKYELNITEEELMERFVRGDSSRHTEGSGLGLSIARNLVEMQGGSFNIVIDGDLFKVIIEFELRG